MGMFPVCVWESYIWIMAEKEVSNIESSSQNNIQIIS